MGTHGRGGFERWVLGSVTEKVLRKVGCPVMTIPPPFEGTRAPVAFKRILCALDFSEASLNALRYALSLAQENDAELALLHAVEWLVEDQPGAEPPVFDVPEYRRYLERDARARLHRAVPEEARDWCHPVELLGAGRAWKEILRVARERESQLIVMGVHGRSAVDLMLFGSTTHHVIRSACCPVLTIRKG
jgi:nucleotide-binding universal stress UspA family protein